MSYTSLMLIVVAAQSLLAWRGQWIWAVAAFPLLVLLEAAVLGFFAGYWF